MTAQQLIPDKQSPHFWLGRLSFAMAYAEREKDVKVQKEALDAFLRSPVATERLCQDIRAERRR